MYKKTKEHKEVYFSPTIYTNTPEDISKTPVFFTRWREYTFLKCVIN